MEINIFNRDLDLIHVIDSFTSIRWVRRYYKTGEFELHAPLNSETLLYLKKDNIVYIGGDEAGYIETREFNVDDDGAEVIVCVGKFLTGYLDRRINWGRVIFDGKAEELIRHLININAINTVDIDRKIDKLTLGEISGLAAKVSYQNSYGNLSECIESISSAVEYGYKIEFNYINKKLEFKVYSGRDLTINQSEYAPCLFSRDFENIISQNYIESSNNYKNTCLIAGAGEDENRKLTTIKNNKGLDRYELFVDARELSDKEKVDGVEGESEIPWHRYEPMLIQKGTEKLGEHKKVETFESQVNLRSNIEYKKDFDLGDIVTCFDSKWGITIDSRITEIEEVYEQNGLEVIITFGNNIPTLSEKIKSNMR